MRLRTGRKYVVFVPDCIDITTGTLVLVPLSERANIFVVANRGTLPLRKLPPVGTENVVPPGFTWYGALLAE